MTTGIPSVILPYNSGQTLAPKIVDQTAALIALTNLTSFVDASQVTLDGSSLVQAVTDQTGKSHGFAQVTAAQRPPVASSVVNNRPVFRMNGSHRLDYSGSFPTTGDFTKFVVARPQTASTVLAASAAAGATSITVASASGLTAGQYLAGSGIVSGTTIGSGYTAGSTAVPLSTATTLALGAGTAIAATTAPASTQMLLGQSTAGANKHVFGLTGTTVLQQLEAAGVTADQATYDPTAFHLFVAGWSQTAQISYLAVDTASSISGTEAVATTFATLCPLGNTSTNNQGFVGDIACAGILAGENLFDGTHGSDLVILQAYISAAYHLF